MKGLGATSRYGLEQNQRIKMLSQGKHKEKLPEILWDQFLFFLLILPL